MDVWDGRKFKYVGTKQQQRGGRAGATHGSSLPVRPPKHSILFGPQLIAQPALRQTHIIVGNDPVFGNVAQQGATLSQPNR